jgi:hypothetical protein
MGSIDFRFIPDNWKSEHQDLVNSSTEDKETRERNMMISICKRRIEDAERMRKIFGDEYTDAQISKWKDTLKDLKGD